ncbi:MAG TPA: site-specific integrase [Candidatus Binataceae bacterium]|nr:site-specific integrase [Candidatus Binataceae bacterium]
MKNRGLGSVYRPQYRDRKTGERKEVWGWWIVYHVHGRRIRENAHSENRADAVRLLKRRLGEAAEGKPLGPELERTTFDDLAQMLVDDYKANRRKSLDRIEDALKHLRTAFSGWKAHHITVDQIARYTARRLEESATPGTTNRELGALRCAFNIASEAGRIASKPRIKMLAEANPRQGFFEPHELQMLLDESPVYLRPLYRVAYITGWRVPSELLTRRWSNIDLEAGWMRLEPGETKNGKPREFPLVSELRTVLEDQYQLARQIERTNGQSVPWIFFHLDGTPIKEFRDGWLNACKRAGLSGRIPHDFRRTAVRNLIRAGIPTQTAMKLTGHLTPSVFDRYAIIDTGMLREAGTKLATQLSLENRRYGVTPGQIERMAAEVMPKLRQSQDS